MKTFSTLLCLVFVLSPVLFIQPSHAVIVHDTAGQGEFFTLLYPADKEVSVKAFDRRIPCHRDRVFSQCLIAVPADAAAGLHAFQIFWDGKLEMEKTVKVRETAFPVETLTLTQEKKDLLKPSKERDKEVKLIRAALGTETPEKLWKEKFIWPVKGKIESLFGEKRILDGKLRENYYHRGLDLGAKTGTPIVAVNDGKVVLNRHFLEEGNIVAVDHGRGVMSAYLHCSAILVREGETVKKGQVIARVGSTGVSNSPHLHFGLYVHDVPIDPLFWFKNAP